MKTIFTPVAILGIISFSSCQQDNVEYGDKTGQTISIKQPLESSTIENEILSYIQSKEKREYNNLSRSSKQLFSLVPKLLNQDTVAFVAQYSEGWEIFSASHSMPMVMFSSVKGRFNLDDPDLPEALRILIENSFYNVSKAKGEKVSEIHPSWNGYIYDSKNIEYGKISVSSGNGRRKEIDYSDMPPGKWVLLERSTKEVESFTSEKLIPTKWGQSWPWNLYAPWILNDKTGKYEQALAGCTAVALAQELGLGWKI